MAHYSGRQALLVVMMEPKTGYNQTVERWYDEEHLAERLAVPGFLSARRYVAVEGEPRHLALYDIEDTEVLEGEAYLIRKAHPTPLTAEVEAHARIIRNVYVDITPSSAGGPGPLPGSMTVKEG